MYPYHIQRIQHLEPMDRRSQLELCRWVNSNPCPIHNILFTDKANFTLDGVNNTRNSHLWDRDNPHGTVKSHYQYLFAVNVWCGVIGDQLIRLYIFPQRLTGAIYANFLRDELPALLENVPLQTQQQMYNQNDGAPPHFSQVIGQYLNPKVPNRWTGCGGTQLATMVTASEPIRLPCVGLHESYGVCTKGEHERTIPANSKHCKKHQQRCNVS